MSSCEIKIVLLGSENVGKTSLVLRYVNSTFNCTETYKNTIGAAFCPKQVKSGDRTYHVGIWDTAGSERYESMTKLYYRGAHAAILCYDATEKETWTRLRHWLQELRSVEEDCRVYVCCTKCDLLGAGAARAVDEATVATYTQGLAGHYETCSKTGYNVDALFQKIVDDLAANPRLRNLQLDPAPSLDLDEKRSRCSC